MESTSCLLFRCQISRFEEYADASNFFARLEWQGEHPWTDAASFAQKFQAVAARFKDASFRVHFFDQPQKLGLFSSKEPHTLIEALNKCEAGDYPNTEICFLIANSPSIEKYAQRYDIPFHYVKTWKDPARHEQEQLDIISQYKPNLIGLARYMKILTKDFIASAGCPIVNIHHSFLPSFIALDQGPIIEQDVVRVQPGDSVEHMKRIGRGVEKKVFATALEKALQHKTITYDNKTIVFN